MEFLCDNADLNYTPAEYRVRIFLSVDLSGSTEYKNSRSGEDRAAVGTPKWVSVFSKFYTDFPAQLRTKYQDYSSPANGADRCPETWKAIGDELVFCGKVSTKKSASTALNAFIDTMLDYRKLLMNEGVDLDLKGAAWLAAFPEPNRTVQFRRSESEPAFLSASEAMEAAADKSPFAYDFLGKAIDTGFRVARSATPERFALSVQLARLLASDAQRLGFGHTIYLDHPIHLKGVNRGEPYPVLYVETMQHLRAQPVREIQHKLLGRNHATNQELASYLREYCSFVGTDEICLATTANDSIEMIATSYHQHRSQIAEHLKQERDREYLSSSPEANAKDELVNEIDTADDLSPLPDGTSEVSGS